MDRALFQQLTASELDRYDRELELAIESHSKWLGEINRALICCTPAPQTDVAHEPHRHCHFGRWYDSVRREALGDEPELSAIGRVHRHMHSLARELLLEKERGGGAIAPNRYDTLVALTDELRRQVNQLRAGLRRNMTLVSKLMGKVFENATEGVLITDPDGVILSINKAFTRVTGYDAAEATGQTPHILYSGRQDQSFYQNLWHSLLDEGQWHGEIWNKRKNGEIYPEWLSITAVSDDSGETSHYVAIFSDITSEKENEERLYHLAHYDALTGLPNRMLFYDRLRQALSQARRNNAHAAVMFLDLDGFKAINDTLGHQAGDLLLQQVAQRLSATLRESDTVARFGGDEFTVIIPGADGVPGVETAAAKLIEAVNPLYQLQQHQVSVTASVGIALYPQHGMDVDELVTHADIAMYQAKHGGKNRYQVFESDK